MNVYHSFSDAHDQGWDQGWKSGHEIGYEDCLAEIITLIDERGVNIDELLEWAVEELRKRI